MTRDCASFGPVRSNILDLSVYDRETGSSLIVYTKLEGRGASQNDGQKDGRTDRRTDGRTDGRTDRQTDRCIADICASLHIP